MFLGESNMKKVVWAAFLMVAVHCSARNIALNPDFDNGITNWINWADGVWPAPAETGEGTVGFGWSDGKTLGQVTGHKIQPRTVYTMTVTLKTIDQPGGQAEGCALIFQDVDAGYKDIYRETFWFPAEYNYGAGTNQQSPWLEYTISFNSSNYPAAVGHELLIAVAIADDGRWDPYGNLFLDSVYLTIPGADDPSPADGSIAPLDLALLQWTKPDPNVPGTIVTSNVYWGTEPNLAEPHYGLAPVTAAQMSGSLWSFNTVAEKKVAHWTMDSKDGGVYEDVSGEGHDAVIIGDPNIVDGVVGNATQVIAINGVGNAGTWDPSYLSGRMTVSCWVKWEGSTGNQAIVSKANDWQNPGVKWEIGLTGSGGVFALGGSSNVGVAGGSLKQDEWTFIAFSFDGVNGTLYVMSDQVAMDSGSFTMGDNDEATVWIGARGSDAATAVEQFAGLIDDVQIFNYPISTHEVVDMYNAAVEPDQSFCVDAYADQFDLDNNCIVDMVDFAEFAGSWLDEGLYPDAI